MKTTVLEKSRSVDFVWDSELHKDADVTSICLLVQRIVSRKYAKRSSMCRSALLERVDLELDLLRGLRLLLLCGCIFYLVVYAANIEKRSAYRLGLLVCSDPLSSRPPTLNLHSQKTSRDNPRQALGKNELQLKCS